MSNESSKLYSKMSTEAKRSNIEDVLPNDEELGRRNSHWRELLKKYEDAVETQSQHSMDIDTAMVLLDQDMSDESSVSDVMEASSDMQSADESDTIKRELMAMIPLRKQQWKENGLKEILDDNEFRMLSQEKVENWLRNHMHTITGQYNVHHQTEEVTTVMETQIDADEDSLYSVDTAQYIRTNKQIKSKVKVTTMIKRYSVTSSSQRLNNFGIIPDEPQGCHSAPSTSKRESRVGNKSGGTSDVRRSLDLRNPSPMQAFPTDKYDQSLAVATEPTGNRRNRRKVFKKTIPRKRKSVNPTEDNCTAPALVTVKQGFDPNEMYDKAMEACVQCKKIKHTRRKIPKRLATANRRQNKFSSCSDLSDSDEALVEQTGTMKPMLRLANITEPFAVHTEKPSSPNKSPTEREIVEPLQSITLSATKRPRAKPAGPAAACATEPVTKRGGFLLDGCSYGKGLIVYRPKEIRPNLPSTERISLRVGDLTLTGVTKKRHLDMFETFDYRVHPNSSICFYPSDSSDSADERKEEVVDSSTENSYDDDDPILTFNPRRLKLLHVVEVPYRHDSNIK